MNSWVAAVASPGSTLIDSSSRSDPSGNFQRSAVTSCDNSWSHPVIDDIRSASLSSTWIDWPSVRSRYVHPVDPGAGRQGVSTPERGNAGAGETPEPRPRTVIDLVRAGALDPDLGALVWLLVEDAVPLTITGSADLADRRGLAATLLAVPPDASWVVVDADAERPGLASLGARIRGGMRLGLTIAAPGLRETLDRLAEPPDGLPEDAVRRLGVVLVLATVPSVAPGPVVDRLRVVAAHYLRPLERDAQGHLQRRPPAVLATWELSLGCVRPLRLGRDAGAGGCRRSYAGRPGGGAVSPRRCTSRAGRDPPNDPVAALARVLAAEPPRRHAAPRQPARTSPVRDPLTDPHLH